MSNSRMHPKNPLVGVGAVVLNEDKILLVKRLYPPGKGRWSIPGGLVEVGEDLEQAVIRELKEETNLDGIPLGVVSVAQYIEESRGLVRYHYVIIDFLVKVNNFANMKAGTDAEEVKLFKLDDALKLSLTSTTKKLVGYLIQCRRELKYIPLITSIIRR